MKKSSKKKTGDLETIHGLRPTCDVMLHPYESADALRCSINTLVRIRA